MRRLSRSTRDRRRAGGDRRHPGRGAGRARVRRACRADADAARASGPRHAGSGRRRSTERRGRAAIASARPDAPAAAARWRRRWLGAPGGAGGRGGRRRGRRWIRAGGSSGASSTSLGRRARRSSASAARRAAGQAARRRAAPLRGVARPPRARPAGPAARRRPSQRASRRAPAPPTRQPPGRPVRPAALTTRPARVDDVAQQVFAVVAAQNGHRGQLQRDLHRRPRRAARVPAQRARRQPQPAMAALSRLRGAQVLSRTDVTQDVTGHVGRRRPAAGRRPRPAHARCCANSRGDHHRRRSTASPQIRDADASIASDLATLRRHPAPGRQQPDRRSRSRPPRPRCRPVPRAAASRCTARSTTPAGCWWWRQASR